MPAFTHRNFSFRLVIVLSMVFTLINFTNPKPIFALVYTITGTSQYVNPSGGSSPIRNARVEIFVNNTYLNFGTTNASGGFSVPVNVDSSGFSVLARVFSIRNDNKIWVKDSSDVTHQQPSSSVTCNPCPTTLSLGSFAAINDYRKRAFFIFDQLSEITLGKLSISPINWTPPEWVSVVYPSTTGSRYLASSNTIELYGTPAGDFGDGFAASPIIHEYAHAVMEMAYRFYPTVTGCFPHNYGLVTTTSCAWTEGWADYFQAWIRNTGNYVFRDGTTIVDFELLVPGALGPASESAVAAALWDIYDTSNTNEPWDQINPNPNDAGPIWDVFKNGTMPDTIGKFQKDWVPRQPGSARKVAITFCAHQAANGCVAMPFTKK